MGERIYCYTKMFGIVRGARIKVGTLPKDYSLCLYKSQCNAWDVEFVCCYNFISPRFFGRLLNSSYLIVYVMLLDKVDDHSKDCILSSK